MKRNENGYMRNDVAVIFKVITEGERERERERERVEEEKGKK